MTGTLLRLRADTYYMPVREGVWIRTTAGSFTLRGANAATWVRHLAPLLDRGVVPEQLYDSLRPEQVGYVRKLIGVLEQRHVLRWEPDNEDPVLTAAFPQQMEFLRHFVPDAQAALRRVRQYPVAVAGEAGRATVLAAALAEAGFADIVLQDAEPGEELLELAADYAAKGVPVRFTGRTSAEDGRHVIGVFPADETDQGFELADRAAASGVGAWLGLVRGQAMLLKGQMPGSGTACVRCAWRRLVHSSVELAATDGLGHVHVSIAAAVLSQELFQQIAVPDGARLAEGVVVDLPRLSVWRTAIDPDPRCPAAAVHRHDSPPRVREGKYPDVVFGARCFGPLVACSPEQYKQVPLAIVRLRLNPPGRDEPIGRGDGPLVAAETTGAAREEAALLAVRASLPGGAVAEVGGDRAEAVARALLRWADATPVSGWVPADPGGLGEARRRLRSLAGELPEVRYESHPSGLWRATVGTEPPLAGLDAEHADERALLRAVAARQLPGDDADIVPAAGRRALEESVLERICQALALTPEPVPVPPLVSAHLVGIAL